MSDPRIRFASSKSAGDASELERILTGTVIRIMVEIVAADNPMQATTSSHMGMGANMDCRKCDNGGTEENVETKEGYCAQYVVSCARFGRRVAH